MKLSSANNIPKIPSILRSTARNLVQKRCTLPGTTAKIPLVVVALATIVVVRMLIFSNPAKVEKPSDELGKPLVSLSDLNKALPTDSVQKSVEKRSVSAQQESKSYLQTFIQMKIQDDRSKPIPPNITKELYDHQGQPEAILEYFKGKKNGTFVEAGGNNGFCHANTLPLELEHGWRGLLIEPIPYYYQDMRLSGRSAMYLEACLSPRPYPYTANFTVVPPGKGYEMSAHLADKTVVDQAWQITHHERIEVIIECYPLYDVMVAAGLTKVDVLALDIQGAELAILKTLPLHLLDIELIMLENNYIITKQPEKEKELLEETMAFLAPHGYSVLKIVRLDYLFVKNSPGRAP